MIYDAPVKLCDLDFESRGLNARMVGGQVSILPTATTEEITAVLDFLAVAEPCAHVPVSEPQKVASDTWLDLTAKLAAVPVGADYDAIRVRYSAAVAVAADKVTALGGLV